MSSSLYIVETNGLTDIIRYIKEREPKFNNKIIIIFFSPYMIFKHINRIPFFILFYFSLLSADTVEGQADNIIYLINVFLYLSFHLRNVFILFNITILYDVCLPYISFIIYLLALPLIFPFPIFNATQTK